MFKAPMVPFTLKDAVESPAHVAFDVLGDVPPAPVGQSPLGDCTVTAEQAGVTAFKLEFVRLMVETDNEDAAIIAAIQAAAAAMVAAEKICQEENRQIDLQRWRDRRD